MARLPQVRELRKHWQWVYQYYWDSGGPVVGAGVEKVYRRDDRYVVVDCDGQRHGPFGSLIAAIDNCELSNVTEATTQIDCTELSAVELEACLQLSARPGHTFLLNQATVCITPTGRLEPVATDT